MSQFKYLHRASEGVFYLDHRLTPEVRAMLAAMASRAPRGGIRARYEQLVRAVAESLLDEEDARRSTEQLQQAKETVESMGGSWDRNSRANLRLQDAEDRLCEYPLHGKVQEFFDQFVGQYGHSSILELSGSPAVYTEGISWFTAYVLFDSPLCAGQEFSTRAIRHRDWPMAREAYDYAQRKVTKVLEDGALELDGAGVLEAKARRDVKVGDTLDISLGPNPTLKGLHEGWLALFEDEVQAWKAEFGKPCLLCGGSGKVDRSFRALQAKSCPRCQGSGKNYPGHDKEPFRPALDRARWALPGTIATGCCHTGHMRERARVIRDGLFLSLGAKGPRKVWESIREGYTAAVPGLGALGLREAVYSDAEYVFPSHLQIRTKEAGPYKPVTVKVLSCPEYLLHEASPRQEGARTYVDPALNDVRVRISFQCSLAVSRDWHRHRTAYPWRMSILKTTASEAEGDALDEGIRIHPEYRPLGVREERVADMLQQSYAAYHSFMEAGDVTRAMMSLPLGTLVEMTCEMGLRDAIYMLELRSQAMGANFEYKAQATEALDQIRRSLPNPYLELCGLEK